MNLLGDFLATFDRLLNQRQILRRSAILSEAEATEEMEYRLRRVEAKTNHPMLYL